MRVSNTRLGVAVAATAVAAATIAGFGGSSQAATQHAGSLSGQTINVALAYPEPKALIA